MWKKFIGRIAAWILSAAFFAWAAVKLVLDWVGRSTVVEDFEALQERMPDIFAWVSQTPWWTPAMLAVVGLGYLIWFSWPSTEHTPGPAKTKTDPLISIAAEMRYAKGRFIGVQKFLNDRFHRVDFDAFDTARHKFKATEVSLRKKGFPTPWLDYDADPVRYIQTNLEYIEKVEPLISAKHLREAKKMAKSVVEKSGSHFVDPNRL